MTQLTSGITITSETWIVFKKNQVFIRVFIGRRFKKSVIPDREVFRILLHTISGNYFCRDFCLSRYTHLLLLCNLEQKISTGNLEHFWYLDKFPIFAPNYCHVSKWNNLGLPINLDQKITDVFYKLHFGTVWNFLNTDVFSDCWKSN